MTGVVQFNRRGPVGWIEIDHPEHANSLTPAMFTQMREAWEAVEADPEIAVAVVTGAGERHFCAGADFRVLAGQTKDLPPNRRLTSLQNNVTKPVIAAVNGAAVGGGQMIVADADFVVATRNATFSDPHTALGMLAAYGSVRLAAGKVPFGEACRVGIAGMKLTAERAYQLGYVVELADSKAELMEIVDQYLVALLRQSPSALRTSFAFMRAAARRADVEATIESALEKVRTQWADNEDAREGARALAEGRPPRWADRADQLPWRVAVTDRPPTSTAGAARPS
jgi:E-phenylitaconyl-CoA hydratase